MASDREAYKWMPDFFINLERGLCEGRDGHLVAFRHKIRLKKYRGREQVDGIVQAASKWRVARAATGLNANTFNSAFDSASDDKISEQLRNSYSAQLIISLAVFSFEVYAKCFGKKGHDWFQHKQIVFREPNVKVANALRAADDSKEIRRRIESFLEKEAQKRRCAEFFDDSVNENLYDVCHFIRHGYAHGALRGYEGLIGVAPSLKEYILDGIKSHATMISKECHIEGK